MIIQIYFLPGFKLHLIELYIVFLVILPCLVFLVCLWFSSLTDNQKEYVWSKMKMGTKVSWRSQNSSHRHIPLKTTSFDKDETESPVENEKRDFRTWARDQVNLRLPIFTTQSSVAMPSSGSTPITPYSDVTTLSALNTPDPSSCLSTPADLSVQQPVMFPSSTSLAPYPTTTKHLVPIRPAPPPPPPPQRAKPFARINETFQSDEAVEDVKAMPARNNTLSPLPPRPPPAGAKPRML